MNLEKEKYLNGNMNPIQSRYLKGLMNHIAESFKHCE